MLTKDFRDFHNGFLSIGKFRSGFCLSYPIAIQDVLFHRIAHDYSCADWDGLLEHLRDAPW